MLFLPGVFEEDVTTVTMIEKHQGKYIAQLRQCAGLLSLIQQILNGVI